MLAGWWRAGRSSSSVSISSAGLAKEEMGLLELSFPVWKDARSVFSRTWSVQEAAFSHHGKYCVIFAAIFKSVSDTFALLAEVSSGRSAALVG